MIVGVSLRDEQVALTRRAILDVVVELTTEPAAGPITVAAVARRSGISSATIYRHFPTRDALVSAAAIERSGVGHPPSGTGQETLPVDFAALWSDLAAKLPVARHVTVTDAGRELWADRFRVSRTIVEQALHAAGRDPDEPELRHMLGCLDVITSVHAFLDFHDRQGLTVDDAVDAALWGTHILCQRAGLDADTVPLPGTSTRLGESI